MHFALKLKASEPLMKFPCIRCGLCCQSIQNVPELQVFNDGHGKCAHLVGKLCDIYFSRPLVCNTQAIYKRFFSRCMSHEKFVFENVKICLQLNQSKGFRDNVKKLEEVLFHLEEDKRLPASIR